MPVYLSPPPQSPLARAAAAVVGALVLAGAFMVGMVAFVVLLGVGLIGGAWFWFRTRHLRRALAEAAEAQAAGRPTRGGHSDGFPADGDVIDAEYSVVVEQAAASRRGVAKDQGAADSAAKTVPQGGDRTPDD